MSKIDKIIEVFITQTFRDTSVDFAALERSRNERDTQIMVSMMRDDSLL
ncbi:hypothetical protein [Hydrococcus rivularis]|nr:hypothetical protein [Hydrococcus rivularis]